MNGGCAKCHAGLDEKSDPIATKSQLENIHCLICHSDNYKRTVTMAVGDPVMLGDNGRVVMSSPNGNILDNGAKIHAFKHHMGI